MIYWLLYRIWRPIRDFVCGNLEALFQRGKNDALDDLDIIRSAVARTQNAQLLQKWYADRVFVWKSDPFKGRLDYVSKPWVSVARGYGDCDDMMAIAEYVLAPIRGEGHRASTYSEDGSGHAVYVFQNGFGLRWEMMSNQYHKGPFVSPEQAVRTCYGEDTSRMYIYGIGSI